jgi:hypothetical protein
MTPLVKASAWFTLTALVTMSPWIPAFVLATLSANGIGYMLFFALSPFLIVGVAGVSYAGLISGVPEQGPVQGIVASAVAYGAYALVIRALFIPPGIQFHLSLPIRPDAVAGMFTWWAGLIFLSFVFFGWIPILVSGVAGWLIQRKYLPLIAAVSGNSCGRKDDEPL